MGEGKKQAQKTKQAFFSSFQITKRLAKQLQQIRQKKKFQNKSDKASFINLGGKITWNKSCSFS